MKNQNTTIIIIGIILVGAIIYFLTRPKQVEPGPTGQEANNNNNTGNTGNISCSQPSVEPEYNIMYNTLKPALIAYMDAVEDKPSTVNVSRETKIKWRQMANEKGTTIRLISGKGLIYQWRGLQPGISRNFVKINGVNKDVPDSVLDRLYMDLDTGCIL